MADISKINPDGGLTVYDLKDAYVRGLIPTNASASNKLATMADVGGGGISIKASGSTSITSNRTFQLSNVNVNDVVIFSAIDYQNVPTTVVLPCQSTGNNTYSQYKNSTTPESLISAYYNANGKTLTFSTSQISMSIKYVHIG